MTVRGVSARRRSRYARAVLAVSLILACGATLQGPAAQAQQGSVVTVSVPAGSLESALLALGRQANLKLVYSSALTAGRQTGGVSGQISSQSAVAQLLSGTGLSYSFTGANTVRIYDPNAGGGNDAAASVEGAIALDTIDIGGAGAASGSGFQGTPDWVYETPASVSVVTREAIKTNAVRDTRELMASVPGVYVGEGNAAFPTVSPNVRGLQDAGRVVVSIDGARQNAQRGMMFGSSGYNSSSGQAFVDSAFIRQVDIEKNTGATAGSAASLGGSVTFRTVSADDLIAPGKTTGAEVNFTRGTNEYDFQGSALAAARISESLSLTAGASRLNLGQYDPGDGEPLPSTPFAMGREAWSSFLKLEYDNHDGFKASLSWMHQENAFQYGLESGQNFEDVQNDSVVARFSWNPANDLIDVNANFWLNSARADETRGPRPGATHETHVAFDDLSFGFTLDNTSRFDMQAGGLSLNYGVEAFRDKATSSATSPVIRENPLFESSYTAFSPPGQRDVVSTFLNGKLDPTDWLSVSGGVRYDWHRLHGNVTYYHQRTEYETVIEPRQVQEEVSYPAITMCEYWASQGRPAAWIAARDPNCEQIYQEAYTTTVLVWRDVEVQNPIRFNDAHTVDIDRSEGAWLPSATVELKPFDWFRPYVSYAHSFRPPTILEAFFTGAPPADSVADWFAPNLELRPETARTWEIGANVSRDGLFTERDSFRFKAAAFDRKVDDFIVIGDIYAPAVASKTYYSFVNLDGVTRMRGIELEGNYDARLFWLGAAATWLETEWPQTTQIFSNGTTSTPGRVFAVPGNVPPEFKLTLDGGVRLFDERLAIGARYTKVTPTQTRSIDERGNLRELTDAYETYDLYGWFRFNEHATLRFSVNNLTDVYYVPATGFSMPAPGRTATMGMQLKF